MWTSGLRNHHVSKMKYDWLYLCQERAKAKRMKRLLQLFRALPIPSMHHPHIACTISCAWCLCKCFCTTSTLVHSKKACLKMIRKYNIAGALNTTAPRSKWHGQCHCNYLVVELWYSPSTTKTLVKSRSGELRDVVCLMGHLVVYS